MNATTSEMLAKVVALVGYEPREDGTTGQIVEQALRDDPNATAEDIADIIREARAEARGARAVEAYRRCKCSDDDMLCRCGAMMF